MSLTVSIFAFSMLCSPAIQPDSIDAQTPQAALKSLQSIIEQLNTHKIANDVEIEIDGLLVDQTKTKIGRDFYDLFYSKWEAPENSKNYTILISEKPFRLNSTLIEIVINDQLTYQSILQPRYDIIEQLADQAIIYTVDYLQNYEEILLQLSGEDQSGSGIY